MPTLLEIPETKPSQVSALEAGFVDDLEQIPFLKKHTAGIAAARSILADHLPAYTESPLTRYVIDSAVDSEVALSAQRIDTAEQHYNATHDELTGVLNRRGLKEKLEEVRGKRYGIVLADVTNFKQINEKISYEAGDEILVSMATVMGATLREGDYIARIGGDEFMMLVSLEAQGNDRRKDELSAREKVRIIKERIGQGVEALLLDNPKAQKLGLHLATGSAMLGAKSTMKSLKESAERNMKRTKTAQHAVLGKYR